MHSTQVNAPWRTLGRIAVPMIAAALHVPQAQGQCAEGWFATAGVGGDPSPAVYTATVWDQDGEGPILPVLVIGGVFTTAGEIPAGFIAAWDGSGWHSLGEGLDGPVNALTVASNHDLIAAGTFTASGSVTLNNIGRWNGTAWSPMGSGMNNEVMALATLPGGDIVAAGTFSSAGGVSVSRIARWNGSGWSGMGVMNNIVWALLVTPSGELIAGGQFTYTASVPGNKVARYNGTSWTGMGSVNNTVLSLGLTAEGDVVAGGLFTYPGSRIARWSGNAWTPMGIGMLGPVWAIRTLANGDLVAGGTFLYADNGTASGIARWSGTAWEGLGQGVDHPNVLALALMPSGELFAGGGFSTAAGNVSPGLARWASGDSPVISQQPESITTCPRGPATFSVSTAGYANEFGWQAEVSPGAWVSLAEGTLVHNGVTLAEVQGASTASVTLSGVGHVGEMAGGLALRCLVGNDCGRALSEPATLTVCAADFDCTGFVDTEDFDAFVHAFEAGTDDADFDGSGFVDTDDFDAFVRAFENGC